MSDKQIWVEPSGAPEEQAAVAIRALEEGLTTLVVTQPDSPLFQLGRFRSIVRTAEALVEDGARLGPVVTVAKPQDMVAVHDLRGRDLTIFLRSEDWKVIPLENLLADFQGTPTRVTAEARDAREALTLLGTLEVGADGVILTTDDPVQITTLARLLEQSAERTLPLAAGEITAITALGLGDRVCVDTASVLTEGEGILVGSQSSELVLVSAETLASGYAAPRSFRVNAGPVHAYVLVPGNRTRYLSELGAGDEVLVVGRSGRCRVAVVGRVKIERRPLVLVRFKSEGREGTIMLQNAETVRLVGESHSPSVSTARAADRILVHHMGGGRHFGMPIAEKIQEA